MNNKKKYEYHSINLNMINVRDALKKLSSTLMAMIMQGWECIYNKDGLLKFRRDKKSMIGVVTLINSEKPEKLN